MEIKKEFIMEIRKEIQVRRIIREELTREYGHSLSERDMMRLEEGLMDWGRQVGGAVKSVVGMGAGAAKDAAGKAVGAVTGAAGKAVGAVGDAAGAAKTAVTGAVSGAKDAIGRQWAASTKGIVDNVDAASKALSVAWAKGQIEPLKKAIGDMKAKLTAAEAEVAKLEKTAASGAPAAGGAPAAPAIAERVTRRVIDRLVEHDRMLRRGRY
jgi:hypothetical protein